MVKVTTLIENEFLKQGAHRMSEYFGLDYRFGTIPAEQLIWVPDKYYYLIYQAENNQIAIDYSADTTNPFERLLLIPDSLSNQEIEKIVTKILSGVTPKQEQILTKYLELADEFKISDIPSAIIENKQSSSKTIKQNRTYYIDLNSGKVVHSKFEHDQNNAQIYESKPDEALKKVDALLDAYFEAGQYPEFIKLSLQYQFKYLDWCQGDCFAYSYYLFSIGSAYDCLSDYQNALKYYEDTISFLNNKEKFPVSILINSLKNLAKDYEQIGNGEKALNSAIQNYKLCLNFHGKNADETDNALSSLAYYQVFYGNQSEAYYNATMAYLSMVKKYGDRSIVNLPVMNNLQIVLGCIKAYQEALSLNAKIYQLCLIHYGANAPKTLEAIHQIAMSLEDLDNFADSTELEKYLLERNLEIFGEKSPETISALYNTARMFQNWQRWGTAQGYAEKAFKICLELYGENNVESILIEALLSKIYRTERLCLEALKIDLPRYKKTNQNFGASSEYTWQALEDLSSDYFFTNNFKEALDYQKTALDYRRQYQGEKEPATLICLHNYATILSKIGRYSEALEIDNYLFNLYLDTYGQLDPQTIQIVHDTILDLTSLKRYQEAYELATTEYHLLSHNLTADNDDIRIMKTLRDELKNEVKINSYLK